MSAGNRGKTHVLTRPTVPTSCDSLTKRHRRTSGDEEDFPSVATPAREGTARSIGEGRTLGQFHHQVVGTDVVQGADVARRERRDGTASMAPRAGTILRIPFQKSPIGAAVRGMDVTKGPAGCRFLVPSWLVRILIVGRSVPSPMTDETPLSRLRSVAQATWTASRQLVRGLSLSRIQAVVATATGIVTVTGAAVSLADFARGGSTGELVAVVQTAGSHRRVTDATVEILTPQDALVATLTPDASGRATHDLKEGEYVVRVSHPRYSAETRRIQVMPQHTTEVRTNLRAGSSAPVKRTLGKGLSAVRKVFSF